MSRARWLYHIALDSVRLGSEPYAPSSLTSEGFVHCSYKGTVRESAALYFNGQSVRVFQIDPESLGPLVREEMTPRGGMPHVFGPIPRSAFVREWSLDEFDQAPEWM